MNLQISKISFLTVIVLIGTVLMSSCRSTKYIPEGERLLSRVQIKNNARDISKEDIRAYVRQQENLKVLGFWKLHLGIYNLSGKDDSKGFNRWLRRIGEAPVVFDSTMIDRSTEQINLFMKNRGYYQAQVSDTIIYLTRKKAKVKFFVNAGNKYLVNDLFYRIEDDSLKNIILKDTINTIIRKDRGFTSEIHDRERERITNNLQNNGFFNFSKEYVYFLADSSIGNYRINDTMIVMRPSPNALGITSSGNHARYSIRDVYFQVANEYQGNAINGNQTELPNDTISYQGFYFVFNKKPDFKKDVLINSNYILPGDIFKKEMVERTQILLSGLRIFKYINIRFREIQDETDIDGNKILDCIIHVVPGKNQSYALELEGTNSSGNLGAAGNIRYQHKNIFRGAELFTVGTRVARQNQFITQGGGKKQFNTLEFGAESSIVFPKFILPFRIERFRQRYNPKTTVALAYNYQRRPDYTRTIANVRMGYTWRASRHSNHALFPLEFNLVNIPKVSDGFWENISNTFLRYTYENHLIANLSYSYVYNQQEIGQRWQDFWYLRLNFESAGNTLNLIAPYWSDSKTNDYHTILGIRYAQYLKTDVDLRFHNAIDRHTSITYRFFGGIGVPYGNFNVLPFEKRYFSGGANSIRAWPVRGLGPGSYSEDYLTYYNQTAEIKLEFNAEYRFPLFWVLEGALFLDVGNIWGLRSKASVEGGAFDPNKFLKQLAVGTGFGTRFDFNFFIFRLDTGLKLHDPAEPAGKRWIPLSRPYTWKDIAFNFAIGYPF